MLTSAEFPSSATPAGTSLHCYILYPDSACTTDTGIINGEDSMMVTKIEVNKVAGEFMLKFEVN